MKENKFLFVLQVFQSFFDKEKVKNKQFKRHDSSLKLF